jgi:hypothetical protein
MPGSQSVASASRRILPPCPQPCRSLRTIPTTEIAAEPASTITVVNTESLEAQLSERAERHGCKLVIDDIGRGLTRAALVTKECSALAPGGAIRLSAARPDRHQALVDLYVQGEPR